MAPLECNFTITGYGMAAKRDGKLVVGQTGERLGSVPGRAVAALDAGDLDTFRSLYRRARRLRLDAYHGREIRLSYGTATLAVFRLPEGVYCRHGDDPTRAARAIGLLAD